MRFTLFQGKSKLTFERFKKTLTRISYKNFLVKVYLLSVFLGLALTGLQASFLPDLVICSSLFGENLCDPVGNYLSVRKGTVGGTKHGLVII